RAGRRSRADDARGIREVPEERDRKVGQGHQAGERNRQLSERAIMYKAEGGRRKAEGGKDHQDGSRKAKRKKYLQSARLLPPSSFRLPASAFLLGCALVTGASAQPYPSKPVRIIVASTPGGGSDFVARFVAQRLTELVGQQVIVENRAGGGGTIGYEYGVKSPPDGYTLTIITATYTINPSLYPIKFDPLHDFTPIVRVARG